jgi:hypothetical protein
VIYYLAPRRSRRWRISINGDRGRGPGGWSIASNGGISTARSTMAHRKKQRHLLCHPLSLLVHSILLVLCLLLHVCPAFCYLAGVRDACSTSKQTSRMTSGRGGGSGGWSAYGNVQLVASTNDWLQLFPINHGMQPSRCLNTAATSLLPAALPPTVAHLASRSVILSGFSLSIREVPWSSFFFSWKIKVEALVVALLVPVWMQSDTHITVTQL